MGGCNRRLRLRHQNACPAWPNFEHKRAAMLDAWAKTRRLNVKCAAKAPAHTAKPRRVPHGTIGASGTPMLQR
jgi:hypothetical protein